jgi:flagellar basal-body rod protein FlgC
MGDINSAMSAAASGLRTQQTRMRIAAENVANANSTGDSPDIEPFRRRIPVIEEMQTAQGARGARVTGAVEDASQFRREYRPGHPAADTEGYVRLPNVETLVEMMDLREAARAYEANLNMIETARAMASRALDLLRRCSVATYSDRAAPEGGRLHP